MVIIISIFDVTVPDDKRNHYGEKENEKVKKVKKKYQKLKRELARMWDKTTLPVIPFDLGL